VAVGGPVTIQTRSLRMFTAAGAGLD